MIGLEGRQEDLPTAVVTGSGSGLGRATSVQLAADGYQLVLVDLDEPAMAETAQCVERIGGKTRSFCTDVSDARSLGDMVRQVANETSSPALLVNVACAGIRASVPETSDAEWSRVLAGNLTGPFLVTRAIVPLMIDRGGGIIINVTSSAACLGAQRRAAQCASTAGLLGLTLAVARDHGPEGIRCIAVCDVDSGKSVPGEVFENVPWLTGSDQLVREDSGGSVPERPEDVAAVIAFLAGPAGKVFNGRVVVLDGEAVALDRSRTYARN
jgi:meso-butanediol dehydrogenase / (S,S)-butanediol dehydrogenase / diacetyl reductase